MKASPRPVVLYVVNVSWFFVSHRLALGEAARAAGFDVHLAAAPDETTCSVEEAGITNHPVPFSRGAVGLAGDLTAARALGRVYARVRPDIVHHVTIKPVLFGSLLARYHKVPHVINAVTGLGTLHLAQGFGAAVRRHIVTSLLRAGCTRDNVTMIFQNRDDEAQYAQAGIGSRAITIRGSGVDLELFRASPEPPGRPVVMLAARLLGDKGVREFVAAARELRARGADADFVLVGSLDPENRSAITREELDGWIRDGAIAWWGHSRDMVTTLKRATIVVLPSYREGLPRVLLEAAATGRPAVATDVPGCRDAVINGVTGVLVPVRSSGALATAIARLLGDPALRAALGTSARAHAEREFSLRQVVAQHLELYRTVLRG